MLTTKLTGSYASLSNMYYREPATQQALSKVPTFTLRGLCPSLLMNSLSSNTPKKQNQNKLRIFRAFI